MEHHAQSFYRYFPVSERDRKWGLHVTTTGESRIPPHSPYPPHGHPKGYAFEWSSGRVLHDHQVIYISSGRGHFESEHTRPRPIETGEAFLLFPGVWHRYAPEPGTGWTEHWVGLDGTVARAWVRNGFFSPREPVFKVKQEDRLLELYAAIHDAIRNNRPALQQMLAGIASHILALLYADRQASRGGSEQTLKPVDLAIHRMRAALETELDLPRLALELGLSYSAFRRAFTRHTGLSPHQYFLELRLARARNLLLETTLAVKEVARQTGFPDEHYFCRLFRRRLGRTPSQWRERSRRTG